MAMNVKELGRFDSPVMICGGAYSNLEATDAMLAYAQRKGIPNSHIMHTGDAIAYCADAEATATRIREAQIASIKGNVEEQLGSNAGDCACGFDQGSACQAMAVEWYAFADNEISQQTRDWCAELPDHLVFAMGTRLFRVVHGSVKQVNRFMFSSLDDSDFLAEFDLSATDVVIAGHTGIPFTKHISGRIWHNSGALGMPANDGTARVWVTILSPMVHGVRFEHVPLDYDSKATAAKMRERGLSSAYADALETGHWPSLDILPETERQATGVALRPDATTWSAVPRNAA